MTDPITDADLAKLRAFHHADGDECAGCEDVYPCLTAEMIARIDAAEARAVGREFVPLASFNLIQDQLAAAEARAVPDGHTRIDGDIYRVEHITTHYPAGPPRCACRYRLVPDGSTDDT
jgi:hypothetical protein